MSNALITQMADAITDALNAATFSIAFTAERSYRPKYTMEGLKSLRVAVVQSGRERSAISRGSDLKVSVIDIGILKKLDRGTAAVVEAEIDGLLQLAEEVEMLMNRAKFACPIARVTRVVTEPIYDPEALQDRNEFVSIVKVFLENREGI